MSFTIIILGFIFWKEFKIDSYNFKDKFNLNNGERMWTTDSDIISKYFLDWIIIYSALIISLSESWFNFYRYYTMTQTISTLEKTEDLSYRKFNAAIASYGTIFTMLFIICIHFWYWLLIFIVGCHLIFNVYCVGGYFKALYKQYRRRGL